MLNFRPGSSTPWGKAQEVNQIAPGVFRVHTASHGGIKLDAAVNKKIPGPFRRKAGWYEEDCEWAIPYHFLLLGDQETAKHTLKVWFPNAWEEVTGEIIPHGVSFKKDEEIFLQEHPDKWIVVSAYGKWMDGVPDGFVGVSAVQAQHYRQNGRQRSRDRSITLPMNNSILERWFLVPEAEYHTKNGEPFFIIKPEHKEISSLCKTG